jgi:two-component system, OmpR family, sensor kinase
VAVSARAAMALVVASGVAGVVDDRLIVPVRTWGSSLTEGTLRVVCFTLAVALVAGLRASLADSRTSDQRSRQFLGFVAHQLRTPVSGIRSNAEALILAGVPPDREGLLANLATESDRIGRLMTSLLRISRLDQGDPFVSEPINVQSLCRDEADRVRSRIGDHVAVVVDEGHGRREPVELSLDATREALANLLDNASRFAAHRIDIRVRSDDTAVEISVADDGPGIAPGQEDRVFDRFVTLDRRGVGLGLSIARGLCEAQRGRLELRRGRFVMWLPTARRWS